jgi:SAM-dependent methyltransferase
MNRPNEWTDDQIVHYLDGIRHSDYPDVFWTLIQPHLGDCTSLIDIGSGPGAFAIKALKKGFNVQAVDASRKSLDAFEKEAAGLNLGKLKMVCGNWPYVDAEPCDVAICAYSFGGDIGTPMGVAKIFKTAKKAVFFISPVEKTQLDFLSKELYEAELIEPPLFKGASQELKDILEQLKISYHVSEVTYDFGFPLNSWSELDRCTLFMADKLGLSNTDRIKEHLKKNITRHHNLLWVPNPRRSALITCLRSE